MLKEQKGLRNIVLITQLGINVLVPTFVLLLLGMWLDSCFGTSFWAIILLILGILGGAKSAYDVAMNSIKRDERQQESIEDLVKKYDKKNKIH